MIYLDANSSSKLRNSAKDAIFHFLINSDNFANASNVYLSGRNSRALIRESKTKIAKLLDFDHLTTEVIFTSSGTESCKTLVYGYLTDSKSSIISSKIEHPVMLEEFKRYAQSGSEIINIPITTNGFIDISSLKNLNLKNVSLVSVMLVNNETGVIQPLEDIITNLRERKYYGPIISDITQAVGKTKLCLESLFRMGLDAVACSGHKLGAIQGSGFCVINKKNKDACHNFSPLFVGGGQQNYLRAGTENLLGIISLSAASEEIHKKFSAEYDYKLFLRNIFFKEIYKLIPDTILIGPEINSDLRVCNTLLLRFPNCLGADLVAAMDLNGVCISSGSACSSGKQSASEGIIALGFNEKQAKEVVRISIDWSTSENDVLYAATVLSKTIKKMGSLSNSINLT